MKLSRRILLAAMALLLGTACTRKGPPVSDGEVKAMYQLALATGVADKIWASAPVHPAKLLLQDMVEPRQMQASTAVVNVQAVSDGRQIAFLLSWADPTKDDLPGPGRFVDACAVQFPSVTAQDVPAPQMGEAGRPVEISFWSANFQAMVNGRKDDIQAIYPRAKVDHYPYRAAPLEKNPTMQAEAEKRYSPARAAGNFMAGPRTVPVQDLLAEGPGTLRPADNTVSNGSGTFEKNGWKVLISRPLPTGIQPGGRTQVAFAVWEGAHQEVGARKMRTAWIPISVEGKK